jgi:hypothetical protein
VVFSPGLLFCGEEDFFISCFELFCNSDDDLVVFFCPDNRTPTPPGGYSRNPYYQSFYNNPASMYAKTLESFSSKLFSSNRSNVENKGTENQKNNVSGIQILTNNNRQRKNNENENNKF